MGNVKMLREQVLAIAKLVNINLNENEIERFQTTIPQTLDVIDVLKEIDTTTVKPTDQVTGLKNVFMSGEIKNTLPRDLAILNAKETNRGLFVTKAVFNR